MNIGDILKERNSTYGDFSENAAISQRLKTVARECEGYKQLSDVQKEGIDMIFVKLSRMLSGHANHKDTPTDISGYATLMANSIED